MLDFNFQTIRELKEISENQFEEREISDTVIRLKLTSQCQWRCHFCHMEGSFNCYDLVWNRTNANSLLQLLHDLKRTRVHLTGGEPTIYPYIFEVINFLRNNNIQIAITTNGQFNLDIAKKLLDSGCNSFTFSVTTFDAKEFLTTQNRNLTLEQAKFEIKNLIRNIEFFSVRNKGEINLLPLERIYTRSQIIEFCFSYNVNINLLTIIGSSNTNQQSVIQLLNECKDYLVSIHKVSHWRTFSQISIFTIACLRANRKLENEQI